MTISEDSDQSATFKLTNQDPLCLQDCQNVGSGNGEHMGFNAKNLSLEFPTKCDSNQPAQLQRLARKLKFCS